MVSIMPGIERAEPERTLTRSGFLAIAELLLGDLFELGDVVSDLLLQFRGILLAVLVEVVAGLGGDREAGRNGQADLGHFGQACAFAAQDVAPSAVTFCFTCTKEIDPFSHSLCLAI